MTLWQEYLLTVAAQVTAISVLVLMLARCGSRHAAMRHAIGVFGLSLILASPLVALMLPRTPLWPAALASESADGELPSADGDSDGPVVANRLESPMTASQASSDDGAPASARRAAGELAIAPPIDPAPRLVDEPQVEVRAEVTDALPDRKVAWNRLGELAGVVWLAGSAVLGLAWLRQWRQLTRLTRTLELEHCRPSLGEWASARGAGSGIGEIASEVCRALGTGKLPPVAVSRAVPMPIVLGVWNPIIAIPVDLIHSRERARLRDVLIHEGAHVVRRDPWINVAQRLTAILWWWHPGVLAVNRLLSQSREEVCDNFVLRHANAADYAQTLLELAERCSQTGSPVPALGLFGARWTLESRISGLLKPGRELMTQMSGRTMLLLAAVLGTACLLIGGVRGVDGDKAPPEREAAVQRNLAAYTEKSTRAKRAPAKPGSRVRPATPIGRLLDELAEQNAGDDRFRDPWCRTMKEIVELGPAAVPELIAELDATSDNMMLRCLGFMLRAMDDKRAVPALIRAIPKTLLPPGSDMLLIAEDQVLAAFMQKHALHGGLKGLDYGFGRPVREIFDALRKLTGQSFDEEQLYGVFDEGTPTQRRLRRELFARTAMKWSAWWEQHWSEFLKDEAYSRVNLHKSGGAMSTSASVAKKKRLKTEGGGSGYALESYVNATARRVFYDLDTGRSAGLPDKWRQTKNIESRMDEIAAWGTREGFDLMGTEYVSPDDGRRYFALRPLSLQTWELGTERWKMSATEITFEALEAEGSPAAGLLLHYDSDKGAFDPAAVATFLFRTREGTAGLLFVGVEVQDDSLKPGGLANGDGELRPIAFYKGRRFAWTSFEELPEKGSP